MIGAFTQPFRKHLNILIQRDFVLVFSSYNLHFGPRPGLHGSQGGVIGRWLLLGDIGHALAHAERPPNVLHQLLLLCLKEVKQVT